MSYARIAGVGAYLPEKIVTNFDLEKTLDTSDEWIASRTGIRVRHISSREETTAMMGTEAAKIAIAEASITHHDIDFIIASSCSQENAFPGLACTVQSLLGIEKSIPAVDLGAACAGFIYAISIAEQYIISGSAKNILVVGSEVMSRTLDWSDRSTCVLFGDGAGAFVLQHSQTPGILATKLHAQGKYKDLLMLPNIMKNDEEFLGDNKYVQMQGSDVFKIAVKCLGEVVEEILEEANLNKEDLDWLVPHQANLRIISATAKKLDLSLDKVILTIAEHGNTSSASIPLALYAGIREGKIKRGDKLLLEAFGGGLAWGGCLVEY